MDIVRHNWLVLGSESPKMFRFVLFRTIIVRETSSDFQKNFRGEALTGSPKYGHFLTPMARLGFRFSKHFSFCLIWNYKTLRDSERASCVWLRPY
jgi:hypothetical protein